MKLLDSLLFYGAVALFIIGIHQAIVVGINYAYWLFMMSTLFFFILQLRKNRSGK